MSMPMPPPGMMPGVPQENPFNPGNVLLAADQPSRLLATPVDLPGIGQRLAVTMRTMTGEMTVFLKKKDADDYAALIANGAAGMSAAGLVVANGNLPQPPGSLPGVGA